jgi:uncharacterized protein YbaR (Trm112 family)
LQGHLEMPFFNRQSGKGWKKYKGEKIPIAIPLCDSCMHYVRDNAQKSIYCKLKWGHLDKPKFNCLEYEKIGISIFVCPNCGSHRINNMTSIHKRLICRDCGKVFS